MFYQSVIHWKFIIKWPTVKNRAATTAPDRRHSDNCTVLLTKACSRLRCADKKPIILLLFWDPCSHFCTAMKRDGRPLPFEFTENEIPVTNHWRLCITTFLFSLCFPPKLFHLCPNKKNTYEKHSATVEGSHRDKFNLMWTLRSWLLCLRPWRKQDNKQEKQNLCLLRKFSCLPQK